MANTFGINLNGLIDPGPSSHGLDLAMEEWYKHRDEAKFYEQHEPLTPIEELRRELCEWLKTPLK